MTNREKNLEMSYVDVPIVIFSARFRVLFDQPSALYIKTGSGDSMVTIGSSGEIKVFIRRNYKGPLSVLAYKNGLIMKKHIKTIEYPNIEAMILDFKHFSHPRMIKKVIMKLPFNMNIVVFTAENYLKNIKLAYKSRFFNIFTGFFLNNYQSAKIFVKTLNGTVIEEKMPTFFKIFLIYIYNESLSSNIFYKTMCRKMTERASRVYFDKKSVKYIKDFINFFDIDLSEIEQEKYACFNDFFCRRFKRGARVAENALALCSPSDCRVIAFETVEESTRFWIKGTKFCLDVFLNGNDKAARTKHMLNNGRDVLSACISDTLGANMKKRLSHSGDTSDEYIDNEKLSDMGVVRRYRCGCQHRCEAMNGRKQHKTSLGTLIICRLAAQDYHRFHSPVKGCVKMIKEIDGDYLTVNPISVERSNVFTQNKRVIILIESELFGNVYAVAVGATMVGSIRLSVTVGTEVEVMQEIGYFQMGGSTIVLLCEKELDIRKEIQINSNAQIETYVNVGNTLAFNKKEDVTNKGDCL